MLLPLLTTTSILLRALSRAFARVQHCEIDLYLVAPYQGMQLPPFLAMLPRTNSVQIQMGALAEDILVCN